MHGGSRRLVDAQWWTVARDIFAYPPEAPQALGGEQAEREVKGQVFAACQVSAEPEELTVVARAQTGHWGFLTYCLTLSRISLAGDCNSR